MKEAEIRVTWRSVKLHFKEKSWLRFPHCLLCALTLTSKFESVNHLAVNKPLPRGLLGHVVRGGGAGCGPAATLFLWVVGLYLGEDLTSALLSAPRRSGWWMGSNQQQTDLPQETSPHHVYGNQHFSRDPLIATEGEGEGGGKQLDSLSFSAKKISTVYFSPTRI